MARHTFHFAAAMVGLAMLFPAGGCNALEFVPLASAEKRLSEDFQTSDAPQIVIDTFNGTIDVSRGDEGKVQVDVTKRASGVNDQAAEAALDLVKVSMIQKDNTLTITAEMVENRPGNFGASIVIAVPAGAELKMNTSNGSIVSEQVTGKIAAKTSNGKVEIVAGSGELELNTSNGAIDVDANNAMVEARTSNGQIKFRGTLADGKHKFKTSNGRIELALPENAEFAIDGHTSNSRIRSDFDVEGAGNRRGRSNDLEGIVGKNPDPQCSIEATSSNGSIALIKAGHDARD
jgi:DUF4097 and DUF4098 domain-containing protein YvlB